MADKISTPKGEIIEVQTKSGKTTAKLTWNPDFAPNMNDAFSSVQQYIDSEVLRLCDKYIPFQTGMLKKSGILGTEIGSGEVRYVAPYAAAQYYNTAQTRSYDAMRGSYWFERMKADHKQGILNGAKRISEGNK